MLIINESAAIRVLNQIKSKYIVHECGRRAEDVTVDDRQT